jgi:hypothetical protein
MQSASATRQTRPHAYSQLRTQLDAERSSGLDSVRLAFLLVLRGSLLGFGPPAPAAPARRRAAAGSFRQSALRSHEIRETETMTVPPTPQSRSHIALLPTHTKAHGRHRGVVPDRLDGRRGRLQQHVQLDA